MSMKSLQLGAAFSLLRRTTPILLVRFGVMLAFWAAALVYLLITGGIALLVGQVSGFVGVILFLIALGAMIPLYKLAYRYVFYMIKAAHIAVISELLVNGSLPEGTNQLEWGKLRVQERFGEMSVMFVVDELVSGVVQSITNTVRWLTSWLPGDSIKTLVSILNRVIRYALVYIDEAIVARRFYTPAETNVWANARDGVVLYAQAWRGLLVNAVALMVISYIPFILVFIVFAAPIGAVAAMLSGTFAGWSIIVTLFLAYVVKVALGDAFAMTAMIAAYQRETAGLTPDPEMVAKLNNASDKFRELAQRAQERLTGAREPQMDPLTEPQSVTEPDVAPPQAPQPPVQQPPAAPPPAPDRGPALPGED